MRRHYGRPRPAPTNWEVFTAVGFLAVSLGVLVWVTLALVIRIS